MKRRKVLIGLGSLAAGSAAAVGTGAFSQVEAERGVRPTFHEDAGAYLSLEACEGPNGSQYVETNKQGVSRVNFDQLTAVGGQGIDAADGQGLNKNATTIVNEVLSIRNAGTQPVTVELLDPDSSDDLTVLAPDNINNGTTFDSEGVYASLASSETTIDLGESICVDFAVKADKDGLPSGTRTLGIRASGDDGDD